MASRTARLGLRRLVWQLVARPAPSPTVPAPRHEWTRRTLLDCARRAEDTLEIS